MVFLIVSYLLLLLGGFLMEGGFKLSIFLIDSCLPLEERLPPDLFLLDFALNPSARS